MSCQIFIDGSSANFFPGNFIRGRVAVHFTSKTDIRGKSIKTILGDRKMWEYSIIGIREVMKFGREIVLPI